MVDRPARRAAIASVTALIVLAAGCSSGDDEGSDPASDSTSGDAATAVGDTPPVVTAASSGAGDTIAFCSLAAGTTRTSDTVEVAATLIAMAPVAPTDIEPPLALVADAWSDVSDGQSGGVDRDADELAAATDELEAYVLDECGVVAEFDPPTN